MTATSHLTAETIAARRATFRKLHETGFFVIPNPWDIGTARYLRSLGFKALATTSSGFAFSHGLPDADWAIPLQSTLEHIRSIAEATDLPVNADFESGYAHSPNEVAVNVHHCIATGISGFSIEDATGDSNRPLYDLSLATERIRAAKEAIGNSGALLTARSECFLTGHPEPLREALRRLEAYATAGADVLFAPGARTRPEIEAIVKVAHPRPVNVLVTSSTPLSLPDLEQLGVRRVSTGSALARAAWTGFIAAARGIAREKTMAGLDNITPYEEINNFFRKDRAELAIDEADHTAPRK